MKISHFQTDSNLEEDGAWISIGDEASLKIARLGNRAYRDAFQKRIKPYRRQIRTQTMDDKIAEKIMIECLAETILLDWSGMEDDKGQKIAYSSAKAQEYLKAYKDFRELVVELASEMENFRQQEDEADEKN